MKEGSKNEEDGVAAAADDNADAAGAPADAGAALCVAERDELKMRAADALEDELLDEEDEDDDNEDAPMPWDKVRTNPSSSSSLFALN